ncbi:HD domain-containing protein [Marinactinospora rubrisoli]|uniref:HD domain-containing protein n=1 Tax=Marinactinospora rubrisoli TaxID=2715399 RepID=A0ABW2KEW2_9ACTN
MTSTALRRALTEPGPPPLPERAAALLEELSAPPRLAAHLRAVHAAACLLTDAVALGYPEPAVDREAVLFGAAVHDIGKTVHVGELSAPGSAHEQAGYELLLAHGIEERLARFARTHADWRRPGIGIEDLLVSVADKVWRGKRVDDLERLLVDRLTGPGREPWRVFVHLDDVLQAIAAGADERLAFQNRHPVAG